MIPAWPDYRDYHQFMRFGIGKSPDIVVQTDFLCDRMEFWDKLSIVSTEQVESDLIVSASPNNTRFILVFLIIALLYVYYM